MFTLMIWMFMYMIFQCVLNGWMIHLKIWGFGPAVGDIQHVPPLSPFRNHFGDSTSLSAKPIISNHICGQSEALTKDMYHDYFILVLVTNHDHRSSLSWFPFWDTNEASDFGQIGKEPTLYPFQEGCQVWTFTWFSCHLNKDSPH